MKPQHIRLKGEISSDIIVVGDPARAKFIAEKLLENSELVNTERGFLIYTGTYKGEKVSIAVHGIGAPSSAIVFEELWMLGARRIIRLGTAGALVKELDIGDIVVASGAAYQKGGTIGAYVPDACMATAPDPILLTKLYNRIKDFVSSKVIVAPVFSSDAFYAEDEEFASKWASRGIVAVEMEVATLYALSSLRGYKSAAVLVISDNLVVPEKKELLHHEALVSYIERVAKAILDVLVANDE